MNTAEQIQLGNGINLLVRNSNPPMEMHYRNGREAKNGDEVAQLDDQGRITHVGVLIRAVAGNDYWNGIIANKKTNSFSEACICDCLHMDDMASMLVAAELDKRPKSK